MATSSQEGSDASSSCWKKKKKKGLRRYYYDNFLCSKWSKIHMAHFKGSPCRNAQVVFFHTWCFSWHAIKYLLNLSTDSNWYSIFVYQIKFYFDIALVLLPPYFALTNVTSVGGTDSTSCQKTKQKKTFLRGLSPHEHDSVWDFRQIYGLMQGGSQVQPDPTGGPSDWDGGHLSTLSCSRNHFERTGALWHDTLPGWK